MDIKYKRMNSNERVRILNPGSVTIPRAEGEHSLAKVDVKEFTGDKVLTRGNSMSTQFVRFESQSWKFEF